MTSLNPTSPCLRTSLHLVLSPSHLREGHTPASKIALLFMFLYSLAQCLDLSLSSKLHEHTACVFLIPISSGLSTGPGALPTLSKCLRTETMRDLFSFLSQEFVSCLFTFPPPFCSSQTLTCYLGIWMLSFLRLLFLRLQTCLPLS